ncbi:hypothetical protein GTR02_11565, partial [Kineococcus sp. R8]|nr:hypothetical protein [Kineococcus siccus]
TARTPTWTASTATSTPRGLRGLQVAAGVLVAVLAVQVGVLAVGGARPAGAPVVASPPARSGAAAVPDVPRDAPAPDPLPTSPLPASPAATDDAAALARLQELRARGLAEHPPTGRWAAQLAAKSIGTTDPAQVAANGSHTFYAGDILAQSRRIADGPAGADVFVLRSDDFGGGSLDARGNPYWTTFAAGPFATREDVQTWCDSVFGDVPAATRGNACLPRRLLPPTVSDRP